MKASLPASLKSGAFCLLVFCLTLTALPADDILFIGNSFTFTGNIPKLVEAIATSKGKTASTLMVATGGKNWSFHLQNPATDIGLKTKPWNWVVLQDYSTEATHAGKVELFMQNGQTFYDRIVQESPGANILLYETWAYDAKNPIFASASSPTKFANPDEMISEIHKNYAALQVALQAKDSKRQVVVAPVGTAFARCVQEHPEIDLYRPDHKHPSNEGSYLSALVIYSTLFQDSPQGATNCKLDAQEAQKLQSVAVEVTQKK